MANVSRNDMLQKVDNANDQFAGVITKTEKAIFDSAVELIKRIDVDAGGYIKNTTANLKLLSDIKNRLARITANKAYLQGVKELAQAFDQIYRTQVAYYSNQFAQKSLGENHKSKYDAMKRIAVTNTIDGLTGAGLQSNVTDELSKMLLRAVTGGMKYSDLVDDFRSKLISGNGSQSLLAKYAGTYATTALTQYAGQNNRLFTDDLGTEWFEYVGSQIETTREFCNVILEHHPYIHVSEIPEILKGNITDQQTGEVIHVAMNPKTGLPKGMIEGTTPENFQINVGGWNCRHQLVPTAKEAVPANIRAKYDSKTAEEIARKKAEEELEKKIAELKEQLKQYEEWKDVDIDGIEEALKARDVKALESQIANMKKIEILLEKLDFLANPKSAMQNFTYEELKAVNDAVAIKLQQFEMKGFEGEKLVEKLQFEANWVQQNKKYPTWQIAEQAYNKKLAEVQKEIALKAIQSDMLQVMGIKTKSPKYKEMLSELTEAYSNGDIPKAQKLIADLKTKAAEMQKRQQQYAAKHIQGDFDDNAYSKSRKNGALWAKDTKVADDELRTNCGNIWQTASEAEKDAIFGYTQSYHNIQEPLRGLTYYGSESSRRQGLQRIPQIEKIIGKSSYGFDMWVQRGDDLIALKKFGLNNYSSATSEEIKALVGKTGTEGAFWSAGVAKGKGFSSKPVVFNIYCPRGTRMMYCEPFSYFGRGGGRNWDGMSKQSNFGDESEILLQRGTTFRITKVEKSGGRWYVDCEVISQNPLPFPYTNGYPYE